MKLSGKKFVLIIVIIFAVIFISGYGYRSLKSQIPIDPKLVQDLPSFTSQELSQYNGDDLNKPIYLALNGLVYNVMPGKEYYVKGGSYHYLAGRDSSAELNLIGGDIIKRKYAVVGKLIK